MSVCCGVKKRILSSKICCRVGILDDDHFWFGFRNDAAQRALEILQGAILRDRVEVDRSPSVMRDQNEANDRCH